MDANEILAELTIPAPCPMDWDRMSGDDGRRYCDACGQHVHNLTAMTEDERASVLSKAGSEGEDLCARLDHGLEETLLIASNGTDGSEQAAGRWQFTIRSIMAAIAAFATILGFVKVWIFSLEEPAPPPPMSKNSFILMGKMVPRRNVLPTTSAPLCPTTASPDPGGRG
jgi:hypothetical protein